MRNLAHHLYTLLALCVGLPLLYLLIALALGSFTVNASSTSDLYDATETIYLSSNGVHLDIVLPDDAMSDELKDGLTSEANFYAFGWGDENFYLNTPTWADLTVKNAASALFLNSTSLMHVTRYESPQPNWVVVKLSPEQLQKVNLHLLSSFQTINNRKIRLPSAGYTPTDAFYKAHGSYTLFYTCNTWANDIFKQSGLRASFWTPFDTGLLSKW